MCELKVDIEMPHVEHETQPEVVLWLAVIERAIDDLVSPAQELTRRYSLDLYNFFYETTPRPNNLMYICTCLLDLPDGYIKIRRRLEELLKSRASIKELRARRN